MPDLHTFRRRCDTHPQNWLVTGRVGKDTSPLLEGNGLRACMDCPNARKSMPHLMGRYTGEAHRCMQISDINCAKYGDCVIPSASSAVCACEQH